MKIKFRLNGKTCCVQASAGENGRKLMQRLGIASVRNSDDATGVTGSDAIRLNGKIVNAGLLVASQLDGHSIETVEALSDGRTLSAVQSALVDAGVVQSGYHAPAAALILTDLLERVLEPTQADIVDAFSGFYTRDSGYQQYFGAVALARERRKNPAYPARVAEEFREDLRDVGTVRRKIDGPQLVLGQKAFVEDRVEPGSCVLMFLRSPHAHAYIQAIDTAEALKLPGVILILTHENSPDVYYTQAGQNAPEPSPYDRKMFNQK
ncbi:MAG: molybdopterin-dependent oxidoreductase Mo/Fe-S-binding subunit, partial [Desulfobacteraceae bacterium]